MIVDWPSFLRGISSCCGVYMLLAAVCGILMFKRELGLRKGEDKGEDNTGSDYVGDAVASDTEGDSGTGGDGDSVSGGARANRLLPWSYGGWDDYNFS